MVKADGLKHWFIPSKKNLYHPHILRPAGLLIVVFIILAQPVLYNLTTSKHFKVLGYSTDISASNIFSLTNQQREQNGLADFSINDALNQAAANKAADMFAKDYWAHNSPDGLTPWSFISTAGYSFSYAGENLAKDFMTSGGVVSGWMSSSEHRANILSSNYKDVGLAVVNGTLLGSETTLVVAMYGAPQVQSSPAPVKPTTAAAPTSSTPKATVPTTQTSSPAAAVQQTPAASTAAKNDSTPPAIEQVKGDSVTKKSYGRINLASTVSLQNLNWGQRVTIFILSTLILINLLKHTLVWRMQKRGRRNIWLRAHPIAQVSILALAVIITVTSSIGVVL